MAVTASSHPPADGNVNPQILAGSLFCLLALIGLFCVTTGRGMREAMPGRERFRTVILLSLPTLALLLVFVTASFLQQDDTNLLGAILCIVLLPPLTAFVLLGTYIGYAHFYNAASSLVTKLWRR